MPKPLHLIVACAENRVISRGGRLPWAIPEDWNFFKAQTAGQIVVLGRRSFATWRSAARDGRRPIVITRDLAIARDGVQVASSLDTALAFADTLPGEIYICGGERIYAEALALDRPMTLHLTLIHAAVEGDVFFPEWRHLAWRETARRESADANFRYTFFTLEKQSGL
ncbi:MAG: dihydrofolate reductase [Opitutus sp.]|nr:dihydrofolate reductase [Opitutus sp.]